MNPSYKNYRERMQRIADITHASAVLSWDQEVHMPPKGAAFRARQLATLSGLAHEMFTSEETGRLLEKLISESLPEKEGLNAAETWRQYQRKKRLPVEFVEEMSKARSRAFQAWLDAKEKKDFGQFAGQLDQIVSLKQREADYIGYEDHPYDALLDEYERGEKSAALVTLFSSIKAPLKSLLARIAEAGQVDDSFLKRSFDKDAQWDYGLELLKAMGYDFAGGRQDLAPHPFSTTFSPDDVRVTTRISENDFCNMAWSCIHEGGHALYEQGLPVADYGLPSGEAASLGIHESQSRLWENNVGRSHSYWVHHYPKLQARFPEQFKGVSLEDFYKAINKVSSSLIRTEADELTYHAHIMIRFELELALIEGSLKAADARDAWNAKYKEHLGVDVPSDDLGVLQDIHWSHGSIGYFPTYSLGSFYAAQFYAKAKQAIPNMEEAISQGDSQPLLNWLRREIHALGGVYTPPEICRRVTGELLNTRYFMDYAEAKYAGIYGFSPVALV